MAWLLSKDRRPIGAPKIPPSPLRLLCRATRQSPAHVRSCPCCLHARGARAAERNRREYSDEVRVATRLLLAANRWEQSRLARSSTPQKRAPDAERWTSRWHQHVLDQLHRCWAA